MATYRVLLKRLMRIGDLIGNGRRGSATAGHLWRPIALAACIAPLTFALGACGGGGETVRLGIVGEPGVQVHERPRGALRTTLGSITEFGSPRVLPVVERQDGWLGIIAPELGNGKIGWVKRRTAPLTFDKTNRSIHVDLSERRVELRKGGSTIHDFEVTVGAFATKTPKGEFAVTDVLTEDINPVYGCCVVGLSARQPNLPPGWLGGDRVGIHGWSGPVGRAESAGCLRAKNRDMRKFISGLKLGTPVTIKQ